MARPFSAYFCFFFLDVFFALRCPIPGTCTVIGRTLPCLFDEALAWYNGKQTRSDRRINDYNEKICSGKQEKPFHEIILQIGNKDDMGERTKDGQLAAEILDEYMWDFQRRNSTLRVFLVHLHMDEATPHLHIDFIPYTIGSKRGIETRVSLKKALAELGFEGGTRSETERNQWVAAERSYRTGTDDFR